MDHSRFDCDIGCGVSSRFGMGIGVEGNEARRRTEPMTDAEIERMVEQRINHLDSLLMKGKITSFFYTVAVKGIHDLADIEYRFHERGEKTNDYR